MSERERRILLVDDEEAHVQLILRAFEEQAADIVLFTARNLAEARKVVDEEPLDLVILDFMLPDGKGVELLPGEREECPFPFVLLTSHGNEQLAVDAMKAGALDYVVKSGETLANMPYIAERTMREWGYITSCRRSEQIIHESEARLRAVLDSSIDPIVSTDSNGIITLVSGSLHRVFGWKPEEVIGQCVRMFMSESNKAAFDKALANYRITGDAKIVGTTREYEAVRKDGSVFPCEVSISSVRLPELGEFLFTGTVRDVSERKRIEEERRSMESRIRQQQRLESIGTLASGVAHEISNPIQGIMNYAELIKDTGDRDGVLEFSDEIIHESERIATIVRNLLSFACVGGEGLRPVHFSDVLESTLALIRSLLKKDQISLALDVPDDLPLIECNSQQIQQVLMNLVTNARDALNIKYPKYDEDKVIRVVARSLRSGGEARVRITVEDHGSGIDEETIEHIFDPFFTTKACDEGTGLGLALSYGIISDHHGEISVESESGGWTRFHVDLPVSAVEKPIG